MEPSQKCYVIVTEFEGCRLSAYQDQRGIWTVGYGATQGGIGPETVWTQEQADQQLGARLSAVGNQISTKVQPLLSQNQFDALCSLVYNIGIGAFTGSTLCRLLNARSFDAAAQEFLKWDHTAGQVNPGLLRRREAEKELFLCQD